MHGSVFIAFVWLLWLISQCGEQIFKQETSFSKQIIFTDSLSNSVSLLVASDYRPLKNHDTVPQLFEPNTRTQALLPSLSFYLTLARVPITSLFFDLDSPKCCVLKAQILKSEPALASVTSTRTASSRRRDRLMAHSWKEAQSPSRNMMKHMS